MARDNGESLHWIGVFDLERDPSEKDDLSSSGLEWVRAGTENPPFRPARQAVEFRPTDLDLGALGYVEEERP